MKAADNRHIGKIAAALAFLSSYAYFQFGIPYHLMRREHLDLFLYDWDYITQTYRGIGWLGRFAGDFMDQFLYFKLIGPLLAALVITAIGVVVYRICRHGLGKKLSLAVALAVFVWSLLREGDTQFLTQYSLVTLGYLSLILAVLQFRKAWAKAVAAIVFLVLGPWCLGSPYHKYYGKLWGTPNFLYEKVIALDVEASRENWDKVLELSEKELYINEASYYFNLACAVKGELGDRLFEHAQQARAESLFLWVSDQVSQFTNGMASEVWYYLGDMTLAEQSAIVALQTSPKHTGARYLVRLAQLNLITGQYGAAQKYLNMLSKTLNYRRWAKKMLPENHSEETLKWLEASRAKLAHKDFIYGNNNFRPVLQGLIEADPDNYMAREYLLCYDLLYYNLEAFMEDYSKKMISGSVYEEAVVVWLSVHDMLNETAAQSYGVSRNTLKRLRSFYQYPESYKNTYWYFYSTD